MVQLTYNGRSPAGDGCMQPVDEGLTAFGRDLIRCMNDLGIIVDVSHCGARTTMEAIRCSRAPVAVSHGACAAVHAHPRNKTDDVLRALAATGGYLGVCAVPAFLVDCRSRPASLAIMVDHLLHAVEVCGEGHVGVGSDWGVAEAPRAVTERLRNESRARGFQPEHQFDFTMVTEGFERWSLGFPKLTGALFETGLSAACVRGILGGNFCRYFQAVAAATEAAERPRER